ncbi:lycopene cyclase family protein [Idiomarina aminovorans]|uniref:lycopene cyclase family protein n=1 Tax=Idiomarina aminovorans TaxID=2914829 RepID=UPI0020059CB1|nr:lycopene cyclase family protein [Idiomarina sp. ATCH4]MCK7460180.1 lycopene cyclase family protein [Idiomarina sp. ATCH4]
MAWLTIIGGGLAGLSLCDEILTNFEDAGKPLPGAIEVYEQKTSYTDDRSFCFFADTDSIPKHGQNYSSWAFSQHGTGEQITHESKQHRYCRLRGIDVFTDLLHRLNAHSQVSIRMGYKFETHHAEGIVVDTRPAPADQFIIKQSFLGKEIKTQNLTQHQATLMGNMRLEQGQFTFDYILPTSSDSVLFEVTQFSVENLPREKLNELWCKAAQRHGFNNSEIIREECAVLPMGLKTKAYKRLNSQQLRWGTGYGYLGTKHWARNCAQSIMVDGQPRYPSKITTQNRFDRALLRVIKDQPHALPDVFMCLARQLSPGQFARFMTEPGFTDYWNVMTAVPKLPFLRALYGRD